MGYLLLLLLLLVDLSPILYLKRSKYYFIKQYGIDSHKDVYHKYDGKPYSVHLKLTHYYANKFKYLLNTYDEKKLDLILACAWVHDVIEDCRKTFNDVKNDCGLFVAEIVFALSNEKGKTRYERANKKYYDGIKLTEYADYLKICDRLANTSYSAKKGSSMIERYTKEYPDFKKKLYKPIYNDMFVELERIMNINETSDKS